MLLNGSGRCIPNRQPPSIHGPYVFFMTITLFFHVSFVPVIEYGVVLLATEKK